MTTEVQTVAVGLVWSNGRLLVGRRAAAAVLGGLAEFPGGKCAPGESPHDAVVREVLEETGLAVIAFPRLQTDYAYPHGPLRLNFFDCVPAAGRAPAPRPPFRWVRLDKIGALPFPPANQAVLESLARFPGPLQRSP